jgi:hypothetical protein
LQGWELGRGDREETGFLRTIADFQLEIEEETGFLASMQVRKETGFL